MNKGYPAAIAAYFFWGFSPVFWKLISKIPALEILLHRILWSLPFLLLILYWRRGSQSLKPLFQNFAQKKLYFVSAVLLAVNWLLFIWAVTNGYIVEASLGYFINPLINVLLGVIFLKEHIRRLQWLAILLALSGVLYLTFNYGNFPWIALSLAGSFGVYGLIRKMAPLGSIDGLAFEMVVLYFPALLLILNLNLHNELVFFQVGFDTEIILVVTGLVTIFPLLLFAFAARNIPYGTLGFIQYIAPSFQFLLGVFVYGEAFGWQRFTGFVFIWIALLIYSAENIYFLRRRISLR